MARKHGSNRRRRRGRFSGIVRLICILLVIGAAVAALTLFFKAEKITVSGNERYSEQEVIDASGLQLGDNLFLMNKYTIAQRIFEKLPYIENAVIRRHLPNALSIEVNESQAVAGIVTTDGIWLISARGKLLEHGYEIPNGCPAVMGAEIDEPVLSKRISFGDGEEYKTEILLQMLSVAREKNMLADLERIDLSDETCLHLAYMKRFTVKIPWGADMAYKLRNLETVVDYLEDNESGEINLMADGKASFIPSKQN